MRFLGDLFMKKISLLLAVITLCAVLTACNPYAKYISPEDIHYSEEAAQEKGVKKPEDKQEKYATRRISSVDWSADIFETETVRSANTVSSRRYDLSNGTRVFMRRLNGKAGGDVLYHVSSSCGGTIYLYDKEQRTWSDQRFYDGTIRDLLAYVEFDNGNSLFILLPKTFATMENGVIEYLPEKNGCLKISGSEKGWSFDVLASSSVQDTIQDCLIQYSPKKLFDINAENIATCWADYADGREAFWCFDGYYRTVPADYSPNKENAFYRCVASYLPRTLSEIPNVTPSEISVLIPMMDTISLQQNESGFWETTPSSNWLSRDFSITTKFYDTRFNTDLVNLYVKMDGIFGKGLFDKVINAYVRFYVTMAEQNHIETRNGGWMIEDYWCESEHTPTHTSLNHLASECLLLYKLADHFVFPDKIANDPAAEASAQKNMEELANLLLLAIEDTAESWIMDDSNLYYSRSQDGTFTDGDYPRLTYTDLFRLQEEYVRRYGLRNSALDLLINAKREWMDANGVDNYLK